MAEYGPGGSSSTSYLTADHLGSVRVVTKDGTPTGDGTNLLVSRHDYLPFGEEIPSTWGRSTAALLYGASDGVRLRFTGMERDVESGLDYFGDRYFSGSQSRMVTPDLALADQHTVEPQSWHLAAYVRSNPLRWIDPTGRELRFSGDQERAQEYACQIYGGSDCGDRLSYDRERGRPLILLASTYLRMKAPIFSTTWFRARTSTSFRSVIRSKRRPERNL